MAAPVVGFPVIVALVRVIGVAVSALVLTWAFHFRGGLSLFSRDKDLIFNVIFPLCFIQTNFYLLSFNQDRVVGLFAIKIELFASSGLILASSA